MISESEEAYMAMEIEYQQFTLSYHRARRSEHCTKEIKHEVEERFEAFKQTVGNFSDIAFDCTPWFW